MTSPQADVLGDLRTMRRLRMVNRSETMPASIGIDLASDANLSQENVEDAVGTLDPSTNPGQVGFGISEILQTLMSRDPARIPITDLTQYQQNLIDQGFAEGSAVATGEWDSSWSAASRQMEREAFDSYLDGNKPGALSIANAIAYLGHTTPTGVLQGVVGAARGIVDQTDETLSRVGAAGGAAAGAVIGATVGSVVPVFGTAAGAAVGAGVGAVAGFFGDLLNVDEGEDVSNPIIDALSPWEEYSGDGGGQKFFEDLNYVATATSMIAGAGIAVKGAAGLKTIATAYRSGTPLGEALFALPAGAGKAGFFTKALTGKYAPVTAGVAGGAIGGLATGDTKGVIAGATIGAGLGFGGKAAGGWLVPQLEKKGLMSAMERPLFKTINDTFTGASAGALGARISSDIIPGISTIEKRIDEEPLKNIPLGLELAMFPLYPSQLLPFKGGKVADALAESKWFRNQFAWPEDMLARTSNETKGFGQAARDKAWKTAEGAGNPEDVMLIASNQTTLRLQGATETKVYRELQARGLEPGSTIWDTNSQHLTAEWNRRLNDTTPGVAAKAQTELYKGYEDIDHLRFLRSLGTSGGRGAFEGLEAQTKAEFAIGGGINQKLDTGTFQTVKGDAVPLGNELHVAGPTRKLFSDEAMALKNEKANLEASLNQLKPDTDAKALLIQDAKKRLTTVDDLLKGEGMAREAPIRVSVANKAIPEEGILGTITNQSVTRIYTDIEDKLTQLRVLRKQLSKTDAPEAIVTIRRDMEEIAEGLRVHTVSSWDHGLVTQATADKMLDALKVENLWGGNKVFATAFGEATRTMKSKVRHGVWANEITNAEDFMAAHGIVLPEGKTIVATGDDILRKDRISQDLFASTAATITENPNMWDSVAYWMRDRFQGAGVNFNRLDDAGIFKVKQASIQAEIEGSIRKFSSERNTPLELHGANVEKTLRSRLHQENGQGVIKGPVRLTKVQKGGHEVGRVRVLQLDARAIKPEQIKDWLRLDETLPPTLQPDADILAMNIFKAIKRGGALGGEANLLRHPLTSLRGLSAELRLEGLPGYVEWARTWHIRNPRLFGAGAGAFVSGGLSASQDDTSFGDIIKDAAVGAGIGLVGAEALKFKRIAKLNAKAQTGMGLKEMLKAKWPEGHYGYLVDPLHRASMALRYTFSLAFDAGRRVENGMVATMKEGHTFTLDAASSLRRGGDVDALGFGGYVKGQRITGEEASKEAMELGNVLHGRTDLDAADEFVARMYQAGVTGYSPIVQESTRAWMIARSDLNKGVNIKSKRYLDELGERVRMLEGYGKGRRTAEKSVNFLFFPFSFQKKLLTTMGDFVTQAPTRALLIHEGFRRFQESGMDERSKDFIDKWIPIADQLKRLNNIAYGVSPGRFFLQGLQDHPTDLGAAAQILASTFIPSGANTPLQQMFGGLGDAAVHLYSPVVITNETGMSEAVDTMVNFIPAIRDIARFSGIDDLDKGGSGLVGQFNALTQGGAPYYQLQQYSDGRRALKAAVEPVATALGYASVDGFLSSDRGAGIKALVEQRTMELGQANPKGQELSTQFENSAALNKQALYNLSEDPSRSDVEDVILQLGYMEGIIPDLAQATGLPTDAISQMVGSRMRTIAAPYASDVEFQRMFSRFFEYRWGPVATMSRSA